MRTPFLPPTLLLFLSAGCGGETPAPLPIRQRLTELAGAQLVPAPPTGARRPLELATLADGAQGWRTITSAAAPLQPEAELLERAASADPESVALTLGGRRGGVFQLVEVPPGTALRFEGRVRARAVAPATEPFHGATFWLAELTRAGAPEELLAEGADPWIEVRHLFPTAAGEEGWVRRERLFRTGPDTRALLIACLLGLSEEVRAGEVDFADVRLEQVPEDVLWRRELERTARGTDGWRAERLVRAELGAETRPSIALLPGEALRVEVRVPGGAPRLEAGIGPWAPALLAGRDGRLTVVVRVAGREVARSALEAPAEPEAARWQPFEVDLAAYAGSTVTLELACEGDLPAVVGAPVLRDASLRPDLPSVLLISIDTLRADRVGAYGYPGETTPVLDALAREGLCFEDALTQAPYTLPAHATLFTGQLPLVHGVQRGGDALAAARSPVLARILGERGLRTQAFTGGGFVSADFGFDEGFDGLSTVDPVRHRASRFFGLLPRALVAEHGPERVLAWMDAHRDEPFFLFVHTYAVHDYDPPPEALACRAEGCSSERTDFRDWRLGPRYVERGREVLPISDADRAHLDHLYDAALRHADAVVGRLLEGLEAFGLADRTIVAVTSDHGEELFERGFVQHGKTVYEEVARIPLILRLPGEEPRRIAAPAMLADVAPTLLGAFGLPPDPRMQGVDLLRRDPGERLLWCEVDDDFARRVSVRRGAWKLIHGPTDAEVMFPAARPWELYRLDVDPAERDDLAGSDPEQLDDLRAALQEHRAALERLAEGLAAVGRGEVDAATLEELRALGYVE